MQENKYHLFLCNLEYDTINPYVLLEARMAYEVYQSCADELIARCNLGRSDNLLHNDLWKEIDSHKDPLDLASLCTALAISSQTHGTFVCQDYIKGILEVAVGPCLEPLLKIGKTQQFDILSVYITNTEEASKAFECAMAHEDWKSALSIFVHLTHIGRSFEIAKATKHGLKMLNLSDISEDPSSTLISALDSLAVKHTLQQNIEQKSTVSPRKKM